MSAEKVIFHLLKSHAPLTAIVPLTRIYPSLIPIGTVLPAIAYSLVSTVEDTSIGMTTQQVKSRIQVTVAVSGINSTSYAMSKALIKLIKTACNHKQGLFNGVITNSVIRDIESPDYRDDDTEITYNSIDFKVSYQE